MRSGLIRIFATCGVAALLITTGCSGGSAQRPASSPTPTAQAAEANAPVACPTTRGVPDKPEAKYLSEITPDAPPAISTRLAYYSDDVRSLQPVLGPKGWQCKVEIGADGGSLISIYPPAGLGTGKSSLEVRGEPACQGCVYGLICALLPKAARTFDGGAYADFTCKAAQPAHEQVSNLPGGLRVVQRVDPVQSILLFRPSTSSGAMAALETCGLAAPDNVLCPAIVDDFMTRRWGMG
jgi:hypothetical protein